MDTIGIYLAAYLALAFIFLHLPLRNGIKNTGFTLLNMLAAFMCFFTTSTDINWQSYVGCLGIVILSYATLRYYMLHSRAYGLALLFPVALLCLGKIGALPLIVGFSYLAFRLSYLVYEVHNGKVAAPSLIDYLGFAFFPLTFLIGPISPYRFYYQSLQYPDRAVTPLVRSLARILIGLLKVFLFAALFDTLDFSHLWFDNYHHGINDFIISCICSGLYLYFNFSGACDIIIGASGILNIHVMENFNNPLLSRNMQQFWNRTHITLTNYFRTIVFMPGVHFLSHQMPPRYYHLNVITMTVVTFLLLGLWHGVALNFIVLGLLNGLGMVIFYAYSLLFKKLPVSIRRYNDTWGMRIISTAITQLYMAFTFAFFENSWGDIHAIYLMFMTG